MKLPKIRHAIGAMLLSGLAALPAQAAYDVENLDRGTVAINRGGGEIFISWRWLGNESDDVGFNVYRNGTRVNSTPITDQTNFIDTNGSTSATYSVRAVVNGQEQAASSAVNVWNNPYLSVSLQQPNGGTTPDGVAYTYSPNDASVGDLDGDGQYEIVLKWDPSNAKDNSHDGYTGNVYLDAYELDGTRLWRIDLGRNIRAGAHYTQFIVYDLDSDGRAEVAVKTADGTVDGTGRVIGSASADHRNGSGYILSGPEFLTIFDGRTGGALATTNYVPGRGNVSSWGDNYGNRVDRFLAGVAYLDGERPSLIMSRGYYTRAVIAAWDWRNNQLNQRWVFDSNDSGNSAYAGQGAHSLTVGDVDQDGRQEIVFGAATIDDNGLGLYSTRLGHGDALHLGDFNPGRAGLEVFMVHECVSCYGNHGVEMHDAATGRILWSIGGLNEDIGRGVAMDIDPRYAGSEAWAIRGGLHSANGQEISSTRPSQINFAAWWDGDLLRELLDGNQINKWNYNSNNTTRLLTGGNYNAASINGTKSNPNLSGDILGDWREEVILRHSNNRQLLIFSTTEPSDHKIRTLMHDPQYRVAIAWQNVAYNQPPHPSFFLGEGMSTPPAPDINIVGGQTPPPTPTPTPTPPDNGQSITVEEDSTGFCGVDGTVDSNHAGFTGTGFANTSNSSGTGIDWRISVQTAGNYMLTWRFANGSTTNRSANLLLDGGSTGSSVAFNGTGSWTSWSTASVSVYLNAGTHALRLQAATGEGLANIDNLGVVGASPQAASCSTTPTPTPDPSPVPSPTPTPSPSPTPTPTPTPTPSPSPSPSPIPTPTPSPVPGEVSASVNINNDWGGGYCASLELTNNTNSDVTWNVSVPVEGTVSSLWNGEYTQSGSTLTVSGVSWNAVLSPGEVDTSVGFCANR